MQDFYDTWWASTEADWKYANLSIGDKKANPILITIHDLHTTDYLAWNQVQIRKANNNPKDGFYSIDVIASGTYEFALSRYPPESKLALKAKAAAIPYQTHVDGFPEGKALEILAGIVELGDTKFISKAGADGHAITIKAELLKGANKLKTWFVLADGSQIPAYYSLATKI